MTDTIFALSSGAPPAAIAVVRISGPEAGAVLLALCGSLPEPRRASQRSLRVPRGTLLDRALVLWFPGPSTATGEDLAELHLHGGRAVIHAVEAALAAQDGVRRAEPGEFTRRAFTNGRLDLAEAEGLADLLQAETELQRVSAMAMVGGGLSRQAEQWRARVLTASATVEAVLDFGDEDDVAELPASFQEDLQRLGDDLANWLARPRAEALREGFRVVLAGPPNAGKSTLFNALVDDEAAITSPVAGTTRDIITRAVSISGVPFLFVDTAGLRTEMGDAIEAIGIERARAQLGRADLVLWLGEEGAGSVDAWEISTRSDLPDAVIKAASRHRVSAITGEGLDRLKVDLVTHAQRAMPKPGDLALNERQHELLRQTADAVHAASLLGDPLLVAESLRQARVGLDALVGRATTEHMLDALFGRFCIGK